MSKKPDKENALLKKVYVTKETSVKLFAYKYANKHKNLDEVIQDLLTKSE